MITQERLHEVLDYNPETGVFTWKKKIAYGINIGHVAGTDNGRGYLKIGIDGKQRYSHKLAWLYMYGEWPKEIDHLNRDKKDNRICNLSDCSRVENVRNKTISKTNKSGVKGVYFFKQSKKWRATIAYDNSKRHIGLFENKIDAIKARLQAERDLNYYRCDGESTAYSYLLERGLV